MVRYVHISFLIKELAVFYEQKDSCGDTRLQ